jgi:pilus assembly protein CpaE
MPSPQPMPQPVPVAGPQAVVPAPVQQAMPQAAVAAPVPQAMPQAIPAQPQMPAGAPLPGAMPTPSVVPETAVSALPLDEPPVEGGEKALPAISIHAFCERQETAGVINESTRDWRMKRTNMKIFMGGLPAAIEFYHKEGTPALIMIESGMRGPELFSQLETLASVCDENTRVVVIGAANDIRLYRQLMDKGVSDYLVPPFHPIGLIRSISALYSDPDNPFVGRVAAFFGAKGGVGSSTLAHNVAWQMAETIQQDTALVDLDMSFGTTGLDFHYDHNSGLEEALAEPDRLDETLLDRIMLRHTPRLSLLPASGNLGRGIMDTNAFQTVVEAVRNVSPFTLLDMPHVWSDWTEAVLTSADDIIVTATLDLASLRNTKNLLDFLKSERPNDPDPVLILNKVGLLEGITVEEFGAAVGVQPSVTFAFEPEVFVKASNNGEMITDAKLAGGTVEAFQRLATRLKTGEFPHVTPSRPSARSLLKKGGEKAAKSEAGESKSFIKKLMKKS